MKNIKQFTVLVLMLLTFELSAQPKEFTEATQLAKSAYESIKSGNIKTGDSLIRVSISKYPVLQVYFYAYSLAELSNVIGANQIMELVIKRVNDFPGNSMYSFNPYFIGTIQNGPIFESKESYTKPTEVEKNRLLFNLYYKYYEINRAFGNRNQIKICLSNLQKPVLQEKVDKLHPIDYEVSIQNGFKSLELVYKGEYDAAIKFIEDQPLTKYRTKEITQMSIIPILIEKGEISKGIKAAEELQTNKIYGAGMNFYLFYAYAKQGDRKALQYYNLLDAKMKEFNRTYYYLGLIDLAEKNYENASKNLNRALQLRASNSNSMSDMLIENWDLYRAFGDLYTGLKEYEKARDNYNISLLYYPEYEPTIKAITNLEMLVASEKANDKTAPVIVITSPSINRGLKITGSGNELLVKGTAKDPSGLKSVTINGQEVYAQAGGDFWGNILVKEGNNSIMITATDKAGNSGNFQFDWSVQKPSANAEAPIIAVTNQEGKNYCLLLASQNYTDNNIPSLENPISDAIKLKLVLKNNYSFSESNIISLFNPSNNDIKRQLLELTTQLQPEDNLVIFYAGHGIWVEKEKKWYWLMTDAKRNDVNSWLPNKEVLDLVAKIPSRHTLLITDACFSGSVFKTRGIKDDAPKAMKELDEKISRIAITSGNDTEVPDQSVFMKYLVKALSENKEKYLTAQKMFITQILEAVMTESKTEPRYGTLELAGHVGGDFIFSKK